MWSRNVRRIRLFAIADRPVDADLS